MVNLKILDLDFDLKNTPGVWILWIHDPFVDFTKKKKKQFRNPDLDFSQKNAPTVSMQVYSVIPVKNCKWSDVFSFFFFCQAYCCFVHKFNGKHPLSSLVLYLNLPNFDVFSFLLDPMAVLKLAAFSLLQSPSSPQALQWKQSF